MSDTTKGGGKGRDRRPGGTGPRGGGGRGGGAGRGGPRQDRPREGAEAGGRPRGGKERPAPASAGAGGARDRGDPPRFQRKRSPRDDGAGEARGENRAGGIGGRPFRKRGDGAPVEQRSGDKPRRFARGERPARTAEGAAGEGAGKERKPFKPKSRGMLSHGEGRGENAGRGDRPKSYGRLSHGKPQGEGKPARAGDGERKPRPARPDRGGGRGERTERAELTETPIAGETAASQEPMRIARRLARAGLASRRDAEAMIAEGRVSVNGEVLSSPARDVGPKDRIIVDGEPLPAIERTRLWLFHKPAGLVTTNRDPEGRATVFDHLPKDMPRVLTIGRLDITTEGLLLLTNDGGLARVLELPSTGWLRRYRVRAHGSIDQARLDELRQGIAIDGVFYGAIEATLDREQGANVWLTLALREGKNREVKRVLGHLGLDVNRLIRLSYGPFQLSDLPEGAVREIHGRTLRDQLGPRLIEEAGADFDAPVVTPFSNKAVEGERIADKGGRSPKAATQSTWISASETAPNKKRAREGKREDALGRLDTKARRPDRERGGEGRTDKPRGERPQRAADAAARPGKRFDGPKKPYGDRGAAGGDDRAAAPKRPPLGARRSANVWIAPGGRPQGPKKTEEAAERAAGHNSVERMERPGSRSRKPGGAPRDAKPSGPRGSERPRSGSRPSGGDRPRGPGRPKKD
ncbi:pseudouridine synthase [Aurantimonas sp. VKM B-3413]|uniref:pseudouridine synthase n=1 Tax=Aurantimonas sp. VKM B-3413 TaxID=2779401 RepID=UPI001E337308|nr:pseudouridine synthase [Aurantimonas sp. VKM B-3413]MCB8836964.1 pseudouridine synthase [Aurantimonas sp. VKM B-3413]